MGSSELRIKTGAAATMLALSGLALFVSPAWPEDMGRVGPVYPVAEPDLLELIQSRLQQKQKSGELDRIERDFRDRSRRSIESPQPVAGLVRTRSPRTFHFDPSVSVPETLRDHEGKVLVAAGTRVNPLDFVSLSNHLILFDARDSAQTRKALALRRHYQGRVHLILTGGSFIDFMQRFDVRVYFDQQGLLVRRLGIHQVPALVTQEGKRLRIEELKVGS
jgi:conjugal transfer pilus assembly protein TraW